MPMRPQPVQETLPQRRQEGVFEMPWFPPKNQNWILLNWAGINFRPQLIRRGSKSDFAESRKEFAENGSHPKLLILAKFRGRISSTHQYGRSREIAWRVT